MEGRMGGPMSVNFGGGSAGADQMSEARRDAGLHVLAHLYESHAARLFDYCVALLGDEVAAVIAVQDSLVAVDAQISKLPDPDRLRVSLYSVARHAEPVRIRQRSEEHTSELQSHLNLVCRLLLEKKKKV